MASKKQEYASPEQLKQDIDTFEKGLAANDKEIISEIGNKLSAHFLRIEAFEKAHSVLQQSIDALEEASAVLLNRLAIVHLKQQSPEKAIPFFEKALAKYTAAGNKEQMMTTAHNLGATALKVKDFETYFEQEAKAYQIALTLRKTRMVFLLGYSLGGFLLTTGKQKEGAIKMLQTSYQIGLKKGYPETGKIEMFLREKGII